MFHYRGRIGEHKLLGNLAVVLGWAVCSQDPADDVHPLAERIDLRTWSSPCSSFHAFALADGYRGTIGDEG